MQPARNKNEEVVKEYRTDDLIVYWYPRQCSHAGKCWQTLPQVFKPQERPWVTMSAAAPEEIIKTIDLCPTDALKYEIPPGSKVDPALAHGPGAKDAAVKPTEFINIKMVKNGPLVVKGSAQIYDPEGNLIRESDHIVLCACGMTSNKPFCDGSHLRRN
ncbi:MAG: (4Fe-4S)-binding protein [Syntrophomonadaceae bacterium]|nr:(4Fe-4S)-binding protein [Syntrophomonadaceae bacterium]